MLVCSISQCNDQAQISQVEHFVNLYLSSLSLLNVSAYAGLQCWTHPYMKAPDNFEEMEDILV